ncbi:hypothetical protein DEO72_LG8g1930 [Vigna unguiculata]|uniref:Uncharacterized protein n=1 Tax=Vigna unguiculata TaxID=3917 RepID=A0A4D6MQT8_VIGUN|nr:hypothetical protein DEO72_LG8g1930 [Vigna unguiculata]
MSDHAKQHKSVHRPASPGGPSQIRQALHAEKPKTFPDFESSGGTRIHRTQVLSHNQNPTGLTFSPRQSSLAQARISETLLGVYSNCRLGDEPSF